MSKRRYTVILYPEPEEGGYSVVVPALPGCVTQGETVSECIANAQEAIAVYVETLEARGEPIPEEEDHPQAITIEVAA
ncbi:MAG: type II toxin-antitoxin system HicB family antitoxin [Chloroflexota bacterium]|nr:MAG: type II toxin-antitoxin system HicB family antitoxin [Chloroflexota bacterium]